MNIIIFDTETTGLPMPSTAPVEKQPRILELGAIVTDGRTIQRELSQLLNPGVPISFDVTKITGIKAEDVKGKPTFAEFLPTLKEFFEGTEMFIAHNAQFDADMLMNDLRFNGVVQFPMPAELVCTAQEYTPVFGYRPKLTDVYERVIGEPLAQTHRALDDVKAMFKFMLKDNFFHRIGVL